MSNWQDTVGKFGTKMTDAVEQQKQKIIQSQEVSAIQKELQNLLETKAALYFNIGKQVHEYVRKGNSLPSQLELPNEELRNMDVAIFNLQAKLNQLEQQSSSNGINCGVCNQPLQADDKFCGSCGAKKEEPQVGPKVQCNYCTQQIPEQAKFCNICGMDQKVVSNYAL